MNDEATAAPESLEVDVVIVGAGPSGLSAAIRLMQLASNTPEDFSFIINRHQVHRAAITDFTIKYI